MREWAFKGRREREGGPRTPPPSLPPPRLNCLAGGDCGEEEDDEKAAPACLSSPPARHEGSEVPKAGLPAALQPRQRGLFSRCPFFLPPPPLSLLKPWAKLRRWSRQETLGWGRLGSLALPLAEAAYVCAEAEEKPPPPPPPPSLSGLARRGKPERGFQGARSEGLPGWREGSERAPVRFSPSLPPFFLASPSRLASLLLLAFPQVFGGLLLVGRVAGCVRAYLCLPRRPGKEEVSWNSIQYEGKVPGKYI
ncbi:uncharacterized protein LOC129337330 [Eublepharis macularius]|uniref:Uncharacterized protein LOC129337330 n=1 Tax=Eublepharis macularius TaxID=481883 RepID=A0AA97K1Q6_EUBMA|nr:uncharacterized protein LOC129337330 [Eublepharis macularius]